MSRREGGTHLATAFWLENSRAPCPSCKVALEERRELLGNWWKLPSRSSDVTRVQMHNRIDQPAHHHSSITAGNLSVRRNDRHPLPGLDHRDLCIDIVHHSSPQEWADA